MNTIDKNYLKLQFLQRIYQKSATEFQSFFEEIMEAAFPDFKRVRPYGNQGDRGNDGYRPDAGIYYQVYAPLSPDEKESDAAKKLKSNFASLVEYWDQISKIKSFNFVFNDKGRGVSIEIDRALAELRSGYPGIIFGRFTAKDLEDVFFGLKPDRMLSLGFNIDSTNAIRIAHESLEMLEVELDRDNGAFVLKALDNIKTIISSLNEEGLSLYYEILQSRALQKNESVADAKQRYVGICKRYPRDVRAFLYLAELKLLDQDYEKNDELLKQAEEIDRDDPLLKLEKLLRELHLGHQIDIASIDEQGFPRDPKARSNCYRIYAIFLWKAGDIARAASFLERAIYLFPDKLSNYDAKLEILMAPMFDTDCAEDVLEAIAANVLLYIGDMRQRAAQWGGLHRRFYAALNLREIAIYRRLQDLSKLEDIARLAKESFELLMQCYFDVSTEQLLSLLLAGTELPAHDFERLRRHILDAEKAISDELAREVAIQFIFKGNLLTAGKEFFQAKEKKTILKLISDIADRKYHDAALFLIEEMRFAIMVANTAKQYPELRREIIECLPNDAKIQKEKLLLLLNYDEQDYDEAFGLLQGIDLSSSNYFECRTILEVARKKKAWDFVIRVIEKLLEYERDTRSILQMKLQLFTANMNLERLPEAIEIGESILSNSEQICHLDEANGEGLLAQVLTARLKRGEYAAAKKLLEEHHDLSKSHKFKSGIEVLTYVRNNEADKAIAAIVEAVRILKTPTAEEYGNLFFAFTEIANLISYPLASLETIAPGCFVKLKDRGRWYFIGHGDELDATRVNEKDEPMFLGKRVGETISFEEKYRSASQEHTIEIILPIDKYINWQAAHHSQELTLEHRWDKMEMVEVPTTEIGVDTKYIAARLEDERQKHSEFFDLYCRNNYPLAFLAVSEGSLVNAIARIANEQRGYVRFSAGDLKEINLQKETARRILSGESFYIDGSSALVLAETGLLAKVYECMQGIHVPQSVISLLLEIKEKFAYRPGHVGFMGYAQGRVVFSSLDNERRKIIEENIDGCIKLCELKPKNIVAISAASKHKCFSEQKVPPELCDACILAQKDGAIVMTEDFLYLQANALETGKKSPAYFSAYSFLRILYEEGKVTFDEYLEFFAYLAGYRFRFLHLDAIDIEKSVFGDGLIKSVRPERIRLFNFSLTLSEEYGVPVGRAFRVVGLFFLKVLIDDSILPEISERILVEMLSLFPTKKNKGDLGRMLLTVCVQIINEKQKSIIIGTRVQEKIDRLFQMLEVFNSKDDIWKTI